VISHADRWVPYGDPAGTGSFDRYVAELIDFVAGGLDAAREPPQDEMLAQAA
jgi:hypothetical protein